MRSFQVLDVIVTGGILFPTLIPIFPTSVTLPMPPSRHRYSDYRLLSKPHDDAIHLL